MFRVSLIAMGLVFFSTQFSTGANAQPTPQQRAACEQDAHRLCADAMPDEPKVRNCLRKNLRRLSPVCRSAFTRRK
jgi:hypothetical protein